jgi:hypothetical protein
VFVDIRAQGPAYGNAGTGVQGIQGVFDLRNPFSQGSHEEPPDGVGFRRWNPYNPGKLMRLNSNTLGRFTLA